MVAANEEAHACWGERGSHRLVVEHMHVHYGSICALRDVTFALACGRSVALVGPNGAGKTTLMRAIVGLAPHDAGRVLWRDAPVAAGTHEVAYLPQRERIDWTFPLTVRALVEMGRYPIQGPLRAPNTADREAVERALETMRVADLARRQIGALSGGQQQRAFIARALAQDAHVLLLDEPFTGLDQPSAEALAETLAACTRRGTLVVASHHDLRTVDRLFDELVLLNRTVLAVGPVAGTLTPEQIERTFGA